MNEEKEQNKIKYLKREIELDTKTSTEEGSPLQKKRFIVMGVSTSFGTVRDTKIDPNNSSLYSSVNIETENEGNIPRYVYELSIPQKPNISKQFNAGSSPKESDYTLDSISFPGDNLEKPDVNETSLRNNQIAPNISEDSQSGYYNGISSNEIDINKDLASQKFYQDRLEDHIDFNNSINKQVLNHQGDLDVSRFSSTNGDAIEEVLDQQTFESRKGQQITPNKNNTSSQNTENKSKISLSSLFTTHLNDKNSDVKLEPIRVVERVIVKNVEKKEKEENVIIRTIKSFLFSILQFVGCLLFLVLSILFVLIIYINFL